MGRRLGQFIGSLFGSQMSQQQDQLEEWFMSYQRRRSGWADVDLRREAADRQAMMDALGEHNDRRGMLNVSRCFCGDPRCPY